MAHVQAIVLKRLLTLVLLSVNELYQNNTATMANYHQGTDTMDVWFDWFLLGCCVGSTRIYPADVLPGSGSSIAAGLVWICWQSGGSKYALQTVLTVVLVERTQGEQIVRLINDPAIIV